MDFPVRPPVPGISGRLPWTPGQLLSDPKAATASAQLTPFELEELTKRGWKPGDPLPSVAAQAKKIAAEAAVPLPVDPATAPPPLVPPDPVDISTLPPAFRDELLAWMASVGRPVAPPPAEPSPPPPVAPPSATLPDSLDAVEYLRAVLAGEPFRREYELYGQKMRVEFRTLTVDEEAAHLDPVTRTWAALTGVTLNGSRAGVPDATVATAAAWQSLVPALRNAPVAASVHRAYEKFHRLVETLSDMADDPNFWPAIAR